MLAIMKRILDLAGSFSASSRRSLVVGMTCNVLKAFFMAGMLAAVWWALENRDRLDAQVALQCLGMLIVSVAGQFVFQYLVDIKMDAEGFHVFRDLRLRVGDRLKGAPMGYFSEQRLSAITATLTTTVHQLEEFMTICLTGLSGGVAMAVIMSLYFMLFAPPVAFITFAGIAMGLVVLEWLRRRSTAVTREVTAAQEAMTDKVIEYARGMAVLRTFATPDEALAEAKASFEQKRLADYRQEQAAQGILKLYALVFNLASCAVLFAACALYLTGGLPLSWALTLLVAAFMIYGELISANNGAFLTKKIEGELDRIDEVCAIPRQDSTDRPLACEGFGLAMENVSFSYGGGRRVIDGVTLSIPEGTTCALVGPSGSGKTTLVLESLVPALKAAAAGEKPPAHVRVLEAAGIERANLIDASPIGINVRSTVATYAGVHDELRRAFARTPEAKAVGLKAGDFSYNTGKLRCPVCDGTGSISLDVQFLPDVDITCPACRGSRYAPEADRIRRPHADDPVDLVSLPDLMAMDASEALAATSDLKKVAAKLQTLCDLGLGYLTLGEATPALSGGEAQRLKLASEMKRTQDDAVFVFDEPTIGLHPLDVAQLLEVFDRLVTQGATVVVIEHDLDVIANADYVIDLGPGGGASGGRIVAAGAPEQVAADPDSITGRYL